MLISIASIGESSKRRVTSTYSSIVEPQTLAMKRVSLKSSVGRIRSHHVVDARVLQADRVQHAHRRLVDAVRRVAEPRLARGALQHDGADVAVREALDARVFLAEADAAGQQHDRRGELQAAEFDAERGRTGFRFRDAWAPHCSGGRPQRAPTTPAGGSTRDEFLELLDRLLLFLDHGAHQVADRDHADHRPVGPSTGRWRMRRSVMSSMQRRTGSSGVTVIDRRAHDLRDRRVGGRAAEQDRPCGRSRAPR